MEKLSLSPGLYDISNDDYHSSDGYSRSQIWTYEDLPYKFWYQYLSGQYVREEKEAWAIGDAWHTLVQEPHLFGEKFFVIPKFDKRTKFGKEAHANAIASANGRTIITADKLEDVKEMAKRIREQPFAHDILTHKQIKFEQSIVWIDEITGLKFKVRPDILCGSLCADLKTTQSASYKNFQSSCMSYGYFLQAAMIKIGLASVGVKMDSFTFICIEKTAPFATAFYVLDEEAINYGMKLFRDIADRLAVSLKDNNWPDYGADMLSIPKYAKEV